MTAPFEWDEAKRAQNLRNHAVDFLDVLELFEGSVLESFDNRRDYGEARTKCPGDIDGRLYVVIYTWRDQTRRIISARKANGREQRAYYARDA
jgi:hypothetical protein